jgi:hypothetical protein
VCGQTEPKQKGGCRKFPAATTHKNPSAVVESAAAFFGPHARVGMGGLKKATAVRCKKRAGGIQGGILKGVLEES